MLPQTYPGHREVTPVKRRKTDRMLVEMYIIYTGKSMLIRKSGGHTSTKKYFYQVMV